MLLVVFGPRTRLAAAVLAGAAGRAHRTLLVAREEAEQAWCHTTYPGLATLEGWREDVVEALADEDLGIAICAAGPIHPGASDFAHDSAGVLRDVGVVARLVRGCRRAHIVFVSSALALWPRRQREYYSGFKGVALDAIASTVAGSPQHAFSVFFPGRLVGERSAWRPSSMLHTSYATLAERIIGALESSVPRRSLVGADARLYACARALNALGVAVLGRA